MCWFLSVLDLHWMWHSICQLYDIMNIPFAQRDNEFSWMLNHFIHVSYILFKNKSMFLLLNSSFEGNNMWQSIRMYHDTKGTLLCLAKVLWSNIFISGLASCLFLMLYWHTHEGTRVHAHVLCTFTHHSFQWFDSFPLTGNNRNIAMPQQKAGKKILVSEYSKNHVSRQRCFVQENPTEHLNC